MSDKMRWRYGDTNPVVAAVAAETEIEIGDLLWQDTDQAKPASAVPDQGDDAENQEFFADHFLGVAMQRSRPGDADPIRVAATGVFEMDCPTTNFELGDLVAPDGNAESSGLLSQKVEKVSAPQLAIGRCAKRGAGLSTVLVDIRSTVMTGGVEGTSAGTSGA